jgi:hypothetical protein
MVAAMVAGDVAPHSISAHFLRFIGGRAEVCQPITDTSSARLLTQIIPMSRQRLGGHGV